MELSVPHERRSGVGVVDKTVAVLDAVSGGPLSLAELVTITGLSRATAHRLAGALEIHAMLGRDERGRYVLGWRLATLGQAAQPVAALADLAMPILGALRDVCGESVQLYVRDGDDRVCIASLEGPDELRTVVAVGARLPLGRGSAGGALLGGGAQHGWVQSVAERAAGVASVSAAVTNPAGEVIAALGVSGPIERTTTEPGARYGSAVAAAADELTAAIA